MRVLIADDDARFLRDLNPRSHFLDYEIVHNLGDAIKLIDRRKKWDAAIFDKHLLADGLPFDAGRLWSDAGFLLAVAFHDKFPDKRSVIVTGAPFHGWRGIPDNVRALSDERVCHYLSKDKLSTDEYGRPSEGMVQMIQFLRGEIDIPSKSSREFLDCILLQPNFCGLGINLKTVIEKIWDHVSERK